MEDTKEFDMFRSLFPAYYTPLSAFRSGYNARMTGKPHITRPFMLTGEWAKRELPSHWALYEEEFNSGWYAAQKVIHEAEEHMLRAAVPSYI